MRIDQALIALSLALAAGTASAQTDLAAREAAADRYIRAVPTAKIVDDMTTEMAQRAPIEQRSQFRAQMKSLIRVEFLEKMTRDAMVKTFTLEELNALADFYSSPHGKSAMNKFGAYMGEIMPVLTAEMERALKQMMQKPPPAPPRT